MKDSQPDAKPTLLPLALGGHSFINQLGNDPMASEEEQIRIVETCLDHGIVWFDTTYQPERIALGWALAALGRRDEAKIIAWNFFVGFHARGEVGGPTFYQPHHLGLLQEQLQTDFIDALVVHGMSDARENQRQEELAASWQEAGHVGMLGTWHPGEDARATYGSDNPYSFMVRPGNVTTVDAGPAFAACKRLGWETFACSPFVRGGQLDELIQKAKQNEARDGEELRVTVADHMLRYALFQPNVDKLIVAMRRTEWVTANAQTVDKGPLSEEELAWLNAVAAD